jgi:hypothetical protein
VLTLDGQSVSLIYCIVTALEMDVLFSSTRVLYRQSTGVLEYSSTESTVIVAVRGSIIEEKRNLVAFFVK